MWLTIFQPAREKTGNVTQYRDSVIWSKKESEMKIYECALSLGGKLKKEKIMVFCAAKRGCGKSE